MSKNKNQSDHTNFTKEEKEQIILTFTKTKNKILEAVNLEKRYNLTHTQIDLLNQNIKFILDGLEKYNKLDWKEFAIETVEDFVLAKLDANISTSELVMNSLGREIIMI